MAILSGFFGLLAEVLATVGLYGVISHILARRRNEIEIRVALGAHGGQVAGMVMQEALWMPVIGVLIGMGLLLAAGKAPVRCFLARSRMIQPHQLRRSLCWL
jgi:ABC-type antimicrobial peptide transport system permease subunit